MGVPVPEPFVVADADDIDDVGCDDADMLRKKPSATAGDNAGGVTTIGALRATTGITNTGALRAVRLFRFELFFLAETPICMVNSTSTTDIAMIEIRTGLTIFDSPFGTASLSGRFVSGFEIFACTLIDVVLEPCEKHERCVLSGHE
jgi:hypothetical protein